MTNAELAEELNKKVGLTGRMAVTANVIRQWVGWDVLPRASAKAQSVGKNPIWTRSPSAVRQAVRLAELRRWGVCRESAVIAQAYFEWGHPDIDSVRAAILTEFRKWRAQLLRRHVTPVGTDFRNLSATQKRAIRNQAGNLDAQFVGTTLQQSDELYALMLGLAATAQSDPARISILVANAFNQITPVFSGVDLSELQEAISNSISGLLGDPEEITDSAEFHLQNASISELHLARDCLRKFARGLQTIGRMANGLDIAHDNQQLFYTIARIYSQISIGPWAVFGFVQCLRCVQFRMCLGMGHLRQNNC